MYDTNPLYPPHTIQTVIENAKRQEQIKPYIKKIPPELNQTLSNYSGITGSGQSC